MVTRAANLDKFNVKVPIEQEWVRDIQLDKALLVHNGHGHLGAIRGSGPQSICPIIILVEASKNRLDLLDFPAVREKLVSLRLMNDHSTCLDIMTCSKRNARVEQVHNLQKQTVTSRRMSEKHEIHDFQL